MNHIPISKRIKYPSDLCQAAFICLEEALYGTGPLYLAKKLIQLKVKEVPEGNNMLLHMYDRAVEILGKDSK